jgi:hypothetical protein
MQKAFYFFITNFIHGCILCVVFLIIYEVLRRLGIIKFDLWEWWRIRDKKK